MKLPWFIPQLRHVEDYTLDYEDDASTKSDSDELEIKEYRDEAYRPWYKFFDEYEYRETTERAARFKLWDWFPEGALKAEKKLITKLDCTLALTTFVSYFFKYLNQSNLNNAYISGMREDLNLTGDWLVNTQAIFTVGQVVFELPFIFLLPRISITYHLFFFEMLWGIFTLATARGNAHSIQALRFLVGASEAIFFPSAHFCQPLWYKSDEIGRRLGWMYVGNFLGILSLSLISGRAVQNPPPEYKGWQFIFIIDGIISIVFGALLTLFLHPGTPQRCYSIWLTDDEIRLARKRMKTDNVDINHDVKSFFDKQTWKNILTSWHFYIFSIAQVCGFNTNSASSGSFGLWLKSLNRYSTSKVNQLTALPPALGILWVIIVCFGADFTRKRFAFIIFSMVMNFVANLILAIWDVDESTKWAGYLLAYFSWSQSSVFNPLISDILRFDQNQRSIEWMIIYIIGLQSSAWISKLTFPTSEEPRYPKGFSSCAGFSIGFILLVSIAYFFYRRDERHNAIKHGIYLYDSSKGELPEEIQPKVKRSGQRDNKTPSIEERIDFIE